MEIVGTAEIKPQFKIECHCCTSTEDVHICELDNCDYPLCSTCKEKALKLEHKCPGCRRSVVVDINDDSDTDTDTDTDSDDDSEPDLNRMNRECKCNKERTENCLIFLYNWIAIIFALFIGICILFILIMIGRLVSVIFVIGPRDYWCHSMGEHAFGWFIAYGLLGGILGFFIICCAGGLLFECLCKEDDGY